MIWWVPLIGRVNLTLPPPPPAAADADAASARSITPPNRRSFNLPSVWLANMGKACVPQVQPAEGIERFLRGGGLIVSATGHCEASAEYESGQGYPDLFHVRFPAPKVRANLAVEAASKRQNSAWRSRGAFGQCLRLLRRAGLAGRHLPVRRQPRPQPAEGGASWRSALLWMGRGMSGAMLTPADAYVAGGLSGRWRKGSGGYVIPKGLRGLHLGERIA